MNKKVPYVIHKHNAFRAGLHYDLRIKYPDKRKLISFAVPKYKFPKGPGTKSIVIRVNDHSLSWLEKQKVKIPRGEYGGGFLEIVQKGIADIILWNDKVIIFEVVGDIADGRYYLFSTGRKKSTERTKSTSEIWILLQKKDNDKSFSDNKLFL